MITVMTYTVYRGAIAAVEHLKHQHCDAKCYANATWQNIPAEPVCLNSYLKGRQALRHSSRTGQSHRWLQRQQLGWCSPPPQRFQQQSCHHNQELAGCRHRPRPGKPCAAEVSAGWLTGMWDHSLSQDRDYASQGTVCSNSSLFRYMC